MTKKIITYAILILFVASTASLPLSIKMCKMKDNVMGQLCMMMDHILNPNSNICTGQENKSTVGFKIISNSDCCTTKIIDNSIKDNFITHETNNTIRPPVYKYIHHNFNQNPSSDFYKLASAFVSSSPPGLIPHNELYLTNSVLLI